MSRSRAGIRTRESSSSTTQARQTGRDLRPIGTRRIPTSAGGIRDSIALAAELGAAYLFYCVNDVEILDPLVIAEFQAILDADPDVVLVSCALTPDSRQVSFFPWMARTGGRGVRQVRGVDFICCALRLDFVSGFGGFPPSKGGWGYAAEVAYHARQQGKKIYVSDRCVVRNVDAQPKLTTAEGEIVVKEDEAQAIYAKRYGSLKLLREAYKTPLCDETLDVLPRGRDFANQSPPR